MMCLDLFSGVGGFSLAASWVWGADHHIHSFVEIDPFCQKVLKKHWPGTPIHDDIRSYHHDGTAIDLLTGGFPCQPFSCAGKQGGAGDDRFLWPEMLRVIRDVQPTWIIGENVAGIIGMELDNVLVELEASGYACQAFVIPACAVNAPHRRDRVWIVAKSNAERRGRRENDKGEQAAGGNGDSGAVIKNAPRLGCGSRGAEPAGQGRESGVDYANSHAADTKGNRRDRPSQPEMGRKKMVGESGCGPNYCAEDAADTERLISRAGLCQAATEQNRDESTNCGWVAADTRGERLQVGSVFSGVRGKEMAAQQGEDVAGNASNITNTPNPRTENVRREREDAVFQNSVRFREGQFGDGSGREWDEPWAEAATRLCALDDGLPGGLARPKGWRVNALKAVGNAIVPQCVVPIMQAIKEVEWKEN